jgi:hypothetical protein
MVWRPDYIDVDRLKSYLSIELDDTADDDDLIMWASASSRAVDEATNRQFGNTLGPLARTYRRPAVWAPAVQLWLLEIDDVQDITGMLINGGDAAAAAAVLLPDDAPLENRPYERIGFESPPVLGTPVVVTARWGWNEVPAAVPAACLLQANRWNSRRRAPFGVAGSPDQQSQVRLLARLDPDVATSLIGLTRRRRVG